MFKHKNFTILSFQPCFITYIEFNQRVAFAAENQKPDNGHTHTGPSSSLNTLQLGQ